MGMRIFQIPRGFTTLFPNMLWRKADSNLSQPTLYLTFDDGPDPEVTLQVLEILKNFNAYATFFVVGENAQKHPEVILKIKEMGHSIGNHTHNHIKGWNSSNEIYLENVQQCSDVLQGMGIDTKLFRPPYGRIKPQQSKLLRKLGYNICMWDILTYDYDKNLNLTHAIAKIEPLARPGSLIVFHDSQKSKNQTLKMLPELLQRWSGKFTFKPLENHV
jgi:peptidoglycan/xylan/chitin deacetylase (PgdA/CDA1 family)